MARRSKPTIDDELIDPLLEAREHGAAYTSAKVSTPGKRLPSRTDSRSVNHDSSILSTCRYRNRVYCKTPFGGV